PLDRIGVTSLGGRLQAGEAFVDVYRYVDHAGSTARYAAFVLEPGGNAVVPLASADSLDALVDAWRAAVTRGRPAEAESAALAEALWAPLTESLAGAARVWVSPDGPLARVPWGALAAAHAPTADLLVAEVT